MNLPSAIPLSLPVTCHTDFVEKGSTFIAIKGTKFNGIDFIKTALEKGAQKIIVQSNSNLSKETLQLIDYYQAQLIFVNNCRQDLSKLSAQAWDYPAKKLNIIGVTGTKGKTTSVFLLNHLLSYVGYKTAMISGIENIINAKRYNTNLTTPLPDYLHAFFYQCVKEQVNFLIMESSAQAFTLQRLYDIEFSGAIFTNLDLEHMEFYSSMNEYFEAKCQIFKQLKTDASCIINIDNPWCNKISLNNNLLTLSFNKKKSDFHINIKKNDLSGLELTVKSKRGKFSFNSPLIGEFNAYNIAGVISLCFELGIYPKTIMDGLQSFKSVPGRMERYLLQNGVTAIIDYAHNPSSFLSVLPTMKSMAKKLIVVFGAGGERDKQKRPIMGNTAVNFADKVIITSDNPRSEDVNDIINQILSGISKELKNKVICEVDRAKAIEKAYEISKKGDVIALLGKGPDEYQIIGNEKFYFSDKETILNCSNS